MDIARKFVRTTLALALLAVGGWQSARAAVVFSNLGPGDSYDGSGFVGNGNTAFDWFPHDIDIASAFRVAGVDSYTFDSIEIPVATFGSDVVALHLFSNDNGPSQLLETIDLTGLPGNGTASPPLAVATSVAHPVLMAGEAYWIGLDVSGPGIFRWNLDNQGVPSYVATRWDEGPWSSSKVNQEGAFRINGTIDTAIPPLAPSPVPEPPAALLFGVGALGLLFMRRRSSVARLRIPEAHHQETEKRDIAG